MENTFKVFGDVNRRNTSQVFDTATAAEAHYDELYELGADTLRVSVNSRIIDDIRELDPYIAKEL